jgi:hypothetical protein
MAARRFREQQVRQIRAGDQQDAPGGCEQYKKGGACVSCDLIPQRTTTAPILVFVPGCSASRRRAIVCISACALSGGTFCLRRATTNGAATTRN